MRLRFNNKLHESGDVWSFFFDTAESINWTAGQSIRLEIPRKSWGYDERRFTIASSPKERYIRITTRLSDSEFKKLLNDLKPGDEIDGHNIEGDFVWDNSDRPKLFLAAGIGITPFRAILANLDGDTNKPELIYGSSESSPVFAQELQKWLGSQLHIVNSRLSLDIVSKLTPNWQERLVYISGPENMVYHLRKQCIEGGANPKNIITDLFTMGDEF